ncbi:MAG: hypothetical protein LBN23_03955 [Paludibacter sp.]|jgi:hypothetical protein|nr:hypothetical protein [Paludibacter sp.]
MKKNRFSEIKQGLSVRLVMGTFVYALFCFISPLIFSEKITLKSSFAGLSIIALFVIYGVLVDCFPEKKWIILGLFLGYFWVWLCMRFLVL